MSAKKRQIETKHFIESLRALRSSFKREMQAVHDHPRNDNVHRLRIVTRKIQAVVWIAKNSRPKISSKRLKKRLRKQVRHLGKLRELDIAIQDGRRYHLNVGKIKTLRRLVRQNIQRQTKRRHSRQVCNFIDLLIKDFRRVGAVDVTSASTKMRHRLEPWVQKTHIRDEELHSLRVDAKKARYFLEAVDRPSGRLRELQSRLGKCHDLDVLCSLFKKTKKIRAEIYRNRSSALPMIRPALRSAVSHL